MKHARLEQAMIEARSIAKAKNALMHELLTEGDNKHILFDRLKALMFSVDFDTIAIELEKSYAGNKE